MDTRASDTILGFASALESSKDVSVVVWGAVVRIWGTLQQVHNVSKAIEAIVSKIRVERRRGLAWGGSARGAGWGVCIGSLIRFLVLALRGMRAIARAPGEFTSANDMSNE